MTNKGVSGWRARMRYNQIASELAFHRSRVARGFAEIRTMPSNERMIICIRCMSCGRNSEWPRLRRGRDEVEILAN